MGRQRAYSPIWYRVLLHWKFVFYGDVVNDNPEVGHRLPPFRFAGPSSRYLAVFWMVYEYATLVT